MGFTTGFTGGVTLTLGLAYLTVLRHQSNRQAQSDALRVNTSVLRALAASDPVAAARLAAAPAAVPDLSTPVADLLVSPPGSALADVDAPARPPRVGLADSLKTRWNAEVAGAVRWAQNKDWVAVREEAETMAAHLWSEAAGSSSGQAVQKTAAAAVAAADSVKTDVSAGVSSAVSAAVQASKEALSTDKAKAVKAAATPASSDVERALQQRYAKADDKVMKKSVPELLEERYKQKS